jgi:hypothetical protein
MEERVMTTDLETIQHSRRGLLAVGAGALAAAAAASLARFTPTKAADGDPVTVGSQHDGEDVTGFRTTDTWALHGESDSSRGVMGTSTSGQGVHGTSTESAGVAGTSDIGNGVHGSSVSNRGVWGESSSGIGVVGSGVTGVHGSGSVGVLADSADGFALHTASGRVRHDGISGTVVMPADHTEVIIETNVPVNENTFVLISPQANLVGRGLWYTIPADTLQIVVHLSDPRPKDSRIAYLIMEHAPAES